MEERIPIGKRVRVTKCLFDSHGGRRTRCLGQTAKILRDWKDLTPYVLEFEDRVIEELNIESGRFCWRKDELEVISEELEVVSKEPTMNDRVMVIMNTSKSHRKSLRDKYVGHTGKIIKDFKTDARYNIEFDDAELKQSNLTEGQWLWRDEEVVKLEDQEFVR